MKPGKSIQFSKPNEQDKSIQAIRNIGHDYYLIQCPNDKRRLPSVILRRIANSDEIKGYYTLCGSPRSEQHENLQTVIRNSKLEYGKAKKRKTKEQLKTT